jgi:hypothetical protein
MGGRFRGRVYYDIHWQSFTNWRLRGCALQWGVEYGVMFVGMNSSDGVIEVLIEKSHKGLVIIALHSE